MFLLVALSFWLSRYIQRGDGGADDSKRHDPDMIVENFAAKALDGTGDVQYTLGATKMRHYADDDSSELENVTFSAFRRDQPPLIATSPKADLTRHANGEDEVTMSGGVIVRTAATDAHPEMTLKTPTLTVLPNQNVARSVAGVVVDSTAGRLTAKSFELNNATRKIVFQNAKMVYQHAN